MLREFLETNYNHFNHLETLPKDLFKGMEALTKLDLFSCVCKLKWLLEWMYHTNATVDQIYCNGPESYKGKKINDLTPQSIDCITTDFSLLKSLEFQSISVEAFVFGGDQYVVFAQTFTGQCSFMEWDHVQMEFRNFDNITIICKPLVIDNQIFIIVAQLFGGSNIFKRDILANKFIKIKDVDILKIRKPNDVEIFHVDGESFFVIVDSSKAGSTTIYKWNGNGFHFPLDFHCTLGTVTKMWSIWRYLGRYPDLPSRGSMVFQPFSLESWQYAILGSDYAFTRVYRWDVKKSQFIHFQELHIQAPRAICSYLQVFAICLLQIVTM
ncbi:Leucine-rich glioma-inactivated protein 1 [Triplophysa tibetana]|uniref:Leucine-rich glioma-inactivated protein 1 n=1 Tax=Triplophysa tibetana TaxID=1572043 RepID=A0A5A9P6G9_9TELE|nr:Leucine-rich glioma-inactivated protein 1 [Triplophysa tibetana]